MRTPPIRGQPRIPASPLGVGENPDIVTSMADSATPAAAAAGPFPALLPTELLVDNADRAAAFCPYTPGFVILHDQEGG